MDFSNTGIRSVFRDLLFIERWQTRLQRSEADSHFAPVHVYLEAAASSHILMRSELYAITHFNYQNLSPQLNYLSRNVYWLNSLSLSLCFCVLNHGWRVQSVGLRPNNRTSLGS